MGYRIRPSMFAKYDKKSIVQYLSQYSVSAPAKFKEELKRYFGIISQMPDIFSKYSTDTDYRHVVVYGSYVMFYTVNDIAKTVYIYRILHGSQDIESIL